MQIGILTSCRAPTLPTRISSLCTPRSVSPQHRRPTLRAETDRSSTPYSQRGRGPLRHAGPWPLQRSLLLRRRRQEGAPEIRVVFRHLQGLGVGTTGMIYPVCSRTIATRKHGLLFAAQPGSRLGRGWPNVGSDQGGVLLPMKECRNQKHLDQGRSGRLGVMGKADRPSGPTLCSAGCPRFLLTSTRPDSRTTRKGENKKRGEKSGSRIDRYLKIPGPP